MACKFDHNLRGDIVSGRLRKVVDDDRQRRTVGYRAIESEQVCRQHLLSVVVRRAHHGRIVTEFGRVFGQPQSLMCRLDAGACDHHFIGSGSCQRDFQHVATLLIGEQNGLSLLIPGRRCRQSAYANSARRSIRSSCSRLRRQDKTASRSAEKFRIIALSTPRSYRLTSPAYRLPPRRIGCHLADHRVMDVEAMNTNRKRHPSTMTMADPIQIRYHHSYSIR